MKLSPQYDRQANKIISEMIGYICIVITVTLMLVTVLDSDTFCFG